MSVLQPIGPEPARVYWIRRTIVLAAAVIVLALIISLVRGWLAPGAAGEEGVDGEQAAAGGAGAAAGAGAAGHEDGSISPAACAPTDLVVTATTPAQVPGGAEPVQFAVTVTNGGTVACTADLGRAGLELVVTSGADRIWSTADCSADDAAPSTTGPDAGAPAATDPGAPGLAASRLLLLKPQDRESTAVAWARTRSAPQCPSGLPAPRPGTYNAVVTVEGAASAPAIFTLP